jgi:hypothetical protein
MGDDTLYALQRQQQQALGLRDLGATPSPTRLQSLLGQQGDTVNVGMRAPTLTHVDGQEAWPKGDLEHPFYNEARLEDEPGAHLNVGPPSPVPYTPLASEDGASLSMGEPQKIDVQPIGSESLGNSESGTPMFAGPPQVAPPPPPKSTPRATPKAMTLQKARAAALRKPSLQQMLAPVTSLDIDSLAK